MKAIVFDKDGTLTPYSLWGEIVYRVFRENLPISHKSQEEKEQILEAFSATAGVSRDGRLHRKGFMFSRKNRARAMVELIALTLRFRLRPLASARAVFRLKNRWQYGYKEKLESIDLNPLRDALSYLKGKGYQMAIFSNDTKESIEELTDAIGGDYFAYIVHEKSEPKKPSPEIFRVYAESLGIEMEDIAFVSDTVEDLKMGRKAGVRRLIAMAGTMEKGDLSPFSDTVIENIQELKAIF